VVECVFYRHRDRYTLAEDYTVVIELKPPQSLTHQRISLSPEGRLMIKRGYSWQGPQGYTGKIFVQMRASLIHSALNDLLTTGQLEPGDTSSIDDICGKVITSDQYGSRRVWWI